MHKWWIQQGCVIFYLYSESELKRLIFTALLTILTKSKPVISDVEILTKKHFCVISFSSWQKSVNIMVTAKTKIMFWLFPINGKKSNTYTYKLSTNQNNDRNRTWENHSWLSLIYWIKVRDFLTPFQKFTSPIHPLHYMIRRRSAYVSERVGNSVSNLKPLFMYISKGIQLDLETQCLKFPYTISAL